MNVLNPKRHSLTWAISLMLLAGCASVPRDAGFPSVQQQVQDRLGVQVTWSRGIGEDAVVAEQIHALLKKPLSADTAVQVALLNNRLLQAEYEELGVAQADVVQAGLLRNPAFGWSRQEGGGIAKTVWGVEFDFLGWLLAGPKQRIDSIRFEHAKLRVSQTVLRHAMETRQAWVEALAAEQSAAFMVQVAELASAEAELSERQRKAGNLSRRDALRQQAFGVETATALSRAQEATQTAREHLNRLMGVSGEDLGWSLPAHLPELPVAAPRFDDLESYGLRQRLDLQIAQKQSEALAAGLNLTRDTRFINVFDLGIETEKSTGARRISGPTLRFELPIFDQGQARISKQEAQYRQSEAWLYALAVDARSEIRERQQRMTATYDIAKRHHHTLVPLRRQIVEESTLHYNGMLIGVYELLADVRSQVEAVQSDIAATRDFWMALAELQMAVGGRLPQEAFQQQEPMAGTQQGDVHAHKEHAQ